MLFNNGENNNNAFSNARWKKNTQNEFVPERTTSRQ